ncbi:glycosyltransferase family 2 protein [Paenibacillus sp. N3.4]|uniref:glycosyltransferase family 2 protein n=1 Tax=Paenibacillus sp. N3.4 TaxID=2603222 RepID=UPI0011CC910B|nr:glycosyltransferase family 2 protein [Paenibacillus sp. N3.4]TXK82510.1 glycosyltransferase [Paenibacillus sp. N3.4]
MPTVSVIVPIYNAGKKLHKCIKSILNQTFNDFELILVNDGSKDKSLDICKRYEKIDRRIMVIDKFNEGSIATRKKGIEASIGKYVMFVDADDWVDSKIIELLYNEVIENNLDIAVCNSYRVLGNGVFIKREVNNKYFKGENIYHKSEIKSHLITAYFHGHPFPSSLSAKLYKKDLFLGVGKYLSKIHFLGDDLFCNLEILLKTNTLKMIDKPLYYYRQGGFTSKYQPYLFEDMVNGYLIQKEVIDDYYEDTEEKSYNGISIMLLNTLKTCLSNLFNSKLTKLEVKALIESYTLNETVVNCTSNGGASRYFPSEFLLAIRNKDVEFLYKLGQDMYRRARPRKILINVLSQVC